jgi:hypothetical protein
VHRGPPQKKKKSKEAVRLEILHTILTKGDQLWRSDQAKERGLGGKLRTDTYMGKLMPD